MVSKCWSASRVHRSEPGARPGLVDQLSDRRATLDETLYVLPDLVLGERIKALLQERPLCKTLEACKNEPGHGRLRSLRRSARSLGTPHQSGTWHRRRIRVPAQTQHGTDDQG